MAAEEADFLEIDLGNLEEEWVRQPRLFHKYALKLVEANSRLLEVEAEVNLIRAELANDIREDPAAFNLPKATIDAVEGAVLIHARYKAALVRSQLAKYNVEKLKADVRALEHKKTALENLVALHGQDYFSVPRAPKMAREEMGHMEKRRARRGIRKEDE